MPASRCTARRYCGLVSPPNVAGSIPVAGGKGCEALPNVDLVFRLGFAPYYRTIPVLRSSVLQADQDVPVPPGEIEVRLREPTAHVERVIEDGQRIHVAAKDTRSQPPGGGGGGE